MKTIKMMTPLALFAAVALAGTSATGQEAVTLPASMSVATTPATRPAAAAGPASKSVAQETRKAEAEKKSRVSGEVGVTLTNAYIFNGLVQDKDTFIAQPYLTLNFMLYEGEGFINDASFTLPLWASIHDINIPRPVNGRSSLGPGMN